MIERMLSVGINGAISILLLATIIIPVYIIISKIKKHEKRKIMYLKKIIKIMKKNFLKN